jgi:hypothetical protein
VATDTSNLSDYFGDLNAEDLRCAGLGRATDDDWSVFSATERRERWESFITALAPFQPKPPKKPKPPMTFEQAHKAARKAKVPRFVFRGVTFDLSDPPPSPTDPTTNPWDKLYAPQ